MTIDTGNRLSPKQAACNDLFRQTSELLSLKKTLNITRGERHSIHIVTIFPDLWRKKGFNHRKNIIKTTHQYERKTGNIVQVSNKF